MLGSHVGFCQITLLSWLSTGGRLIIIYKISAFSLILGSEIAILGVHGGGVGGHGGVTVTHFVGHVEPAVKLE